MTVGAALSRRRQRDGARWHYYACFDHHHLRGACPGVGHHSTEGWVPRLLAGIAEVYAERDLPERLHAEMVRRPDELAAAREIRRLERAVDGLLAVARAGSLRGTAAARVAAELSEAQAALDAARARQRHDRGPTRPVLSVGALRALLRALSHDLRALRAEPPPDTARALLHRYLRRVEVSRTGVRAEVECGAVLRDSQASGCLGASIRRLVVWRLAARSNRARG